MIISFPRPPGGRKKYQRPLRPSVLKFNLHIYSVISQEASGVGVILERQANAVP